jgi:HEAT repeat protein
MLQVAGKEESVPWLGGVLAIDELCDPAARALVNIGTPSAAAALLKALPMLKEANRLTIINALGELRVKEAVDAILPFAASEDLNTRRVAWYALANIGSPKSVEVLAKAMQAKSHFERQHATAMYLLCAQRIAEAGNKPQAAEMCRQLITVRTQPQEDNVACDALATLTKVIGEEALDDLLKATDNSSKRLRCAALMLIQPMPGDAVTEKLTAKLNQPDAERRAEVVETLGRRNDAKAWAAAVGALKDKEPAVRLAAIAAVARPANAQSTAALVEAMKIAAAEDVKPIQDALLRMPGESMAAVADAIAASPAAAKVALLQVLASRRAKGQVGQVLAATSDADASVRQAALKALGGVASPADLPRLIDLLLKAQDGREQAEAVGAVVAVSQRIADPEKRAEPVLAAMEKATGTKRTSLFAALSQLGGQAALQAVVKETTSADAAVADAAIRALADWRDASAADALLKIAQTAEKPNQQVLALRGYIRLAGLPNQRAVPATVKMYKQAMDAAKRPDEKRMALSGLSAIRNVAALRLVAEYLPDEAIGGEAAMAAMKIVLPAARNEKPLSGAEVTEIVKKVAAAAKAPAVRAQAENYLKQAK